MSLADHILAAVAKATPQAPMRDSEIYAAFRGKHRIETGECAAALETMTVQRLLNTARITRNGVTQDVYWPTGLKLPALTGVQPKELRIVPAASTPDTHGSRLIKVIVAHGPLIGAELADKAGLPAKNIDPYLATAIKNGTIHTRMGFVAELGKERKHYMTATQAQDWDERLQTSAPGGHAMSHPQALEARASTRLDGDTHFADDATLARLRQIEEDNQALAADALILSSLAERLQVTRHEDAPGALDELLHALATRAVTARGSAGRLALLLIDSADLTEIEELPAGLSDQDAEYAARAAVLQGNAARAVVVRIQGEARLQVEWKEAA